MTILFWINRSRGGAIYCRITVDGKRAEIATGCKLKGKWLNGRTEDAITNTRLAEIEFKLRKIELLLSVSEEVYDATTIKEKYESKEKKKPTPRVLDIIEEKDKLYSATKAHLAKYLEKKNPKLSELDQGFADGFARSLREQVKPSTINAYFAKLEASIRQAIKDHPKELFPSMITKMPFERPEIRTEPNQLVPKSKHLSLKQYKKLKERMWDDFMRYNQYANLFEIQCMTGMAMADLNRLNETMIHTEISGKKYLRYNRVKNGQEAVVPLSNTEVETIVAWCMFKGQLTERKYNRALKEIGKRIGFDNMTSHVGRHTFGVLKLIEGYSMEAVKKMMGHSSIKMTEKVYAQVTLDKLFSEQSKLAM